MSVGMSVVTVIQRFLLRLIQIIATKFLSIYYGGETEKVPTPKSSVLMESATSLAGRIRNGKVTSSEVVRAFVDRIREVNQVLNCVVDERFEEALEEAKKVDEFIASGVKTKEEIKRDTPYLGVPFTAKDSIAVSGLVHAAGTRARKGVRAEKDSEVVALVRKAGAIPLAITNVAELCFSWESNNPLFGRTKNPYNTNRTAGGSSGGEASLITSCGSPMGIGSDLGGSIRIPAAFNGIFGHKPSAEVTPLEGLFPNLSPPLLSYNTVGPMSRFSADLLPLLKVMTTRSEVDLKLNEPVDLKDLKVYYLEDDGGGNLLSPVAPEIKAAVKKVADHFKKAYGVQAQKLNVPAMRRAHDIWLTKMASEDTNITSQLVDGEGKMNIAKEMLKTALGLSHHTMTTLLMALRLKAAAASADGLQSKINSNMYRQMEKDLQEQLGTNGVLIYPTLPTTACYHYETLVRPFDVAYTGIFNVLGLPSTQCPMGMDRDGLPIGIQIVGGKYQDRLTIAVAREVEEVFGGWRPSPTKGFLTLKNRTLIESKS